MPDEKKNRTGQKQNAKGATYGLYLGTNEERARRIAQLDVDAGRLGMTRGAYLVAVADRQLVPIDPSVPGAARAIAATAALRAVPAAPTPPNPVLATIAVNHEDYRFRIEAYQFEIWVSITAPEPQPVRIYRYASDGLAQVAFDIPTSAWDLAALVALLNRHLAWADDE
jgi:hypothetical protein